MFLEALANEKGGNRTSILIDLLDDHMTKYLAQQKIDRRKAEVAHRLHAR